MIIVGYMYKLFIISMIIILYYKYGKSCLINYAPAVSRYFSLTKYFPKSDIDGVVELAMIAASHVLFCALLIVILPVKFAVIHVDWVDVPAYFIYGVLLGIGCMGLSALLCKIAIKLVDLFRKDGAYNLKSWLTMGRGGWIKHHLQSIEILPIYLSLLILVMQVGSEEVIFRGVILNYFMQFGDFAAFSTAWILFVLMQAFLMNKWQCAIFPMIGAGVMGFIHSVLYLQVPILWPLIIAHVTFFLFSVI